MGVAADVTHKMGCFFKGSNVEQVDRGGSGLIPCHRGFPASAGVGDRPCHLTIGSF